MENLPKKQEKSWLEKVINTLLIDAFYRKFISVGEKRIYLNNLYEFIKKQLGVTWVKKVPFMSMARKIYRKYKNRYKFYKKNKRLQRIQRKYPKLQLTEAFFYLSLKKNWKLKDEDLETFDEILEIIFARLKQERKQKNN